MNRWKWLRRMSRFLLIPMCAVAFAVPCFADEGQPVAIKSIEQFKDPGFDNAEVEGYPSAQVCKTCHPKHFDQWRVSNHAYAQISPLFINFTKIIQEKTSGTTGTFCIRCHTPVGVALGTRSDTPLKEQTKVGLEGVTCVVCHRVKNSHGRTRGELVIETGVLEDDVYGPFDKIKPVPIGREDKETHKAEALPFIRRAEFCGQCHDVTGPDGFRIEDLFTEYRNSPAAREGVSCQDCHMGTKQGVKSPRAKGPIAVIKGKKFPERTLSDHTFSGPDYSMLPVSEFPIRPNEWPVLMDDPNFYQWIAKVDAKLKAGKKLNRLDKRKYKKFERLLKKSEELLETARQKRHELLRNAAEVSVEVPESIERGDDLDIRVTVKNKMSGHALPAGFSAERQVWLEVTVKDDRGFIVYQSGDLDSNGDLRDNKSMDVLQGKVPYDHDLFNLQTKFRLQTVAGTERSDHFPVPRDVDNFYFSRPAPFLSASFNGPSQARQQKNSLMPLQSRTKKYEAETHEKAAYYDVSVKLNYRHFAPILLKQIEAHDFIPQLEIVELDAKQLRVPVQGNPPLSREVKSWWEFGGWGG